MKSTSCGMLNERVYKVVTPHKDNMPISVVGSFD